MIKKCFIPVCLRQEGPSGQAGSQPHHESRCDEGRNELFVCLLPRALWPWAGITEPWASATPSGGFGMGEPGDPCCGLRAELRPQGGVGLGRMEFVVPGKGTVLAGEPKCCREQ